MDNLTANEIIGLVHEEMDSARKLIRDQISKPAAADYDANQGAIRTRIDARLAPSRPRPEECEPDICLVADVVDEEPEPIRHLRRYSSYMNPRAGLFSADSWTLAAIYTRNVMINLLLLLPLVMSVVLLLRGTICLYETFARTPDPKLLTWNNWKWPAIPLFLGGACSMMLAFGLNARALLRFRFPKRKRHGTGYFWVRLLWLSMFVGTVLVTMTYQPFVKWMTDQPPVEWMRETMKPFLEWMRKMQILPGVDASSPDLGYLGLLNIICHIVPIGVFMFVVSSFTFVRLVKKWLKNDPVAVELGFFNILRLPIAAVGGGVATAVLITLLEELLRLMILEEKPWLCAMAGPPLLLLAVVVGIAADVALLGRLGFESEREWWGRLAAALLLMALGWYAALGVIVFGPAVLLGSHQLMAAALASGWVATTFAGVLAGKSGATGSAGSDRRLEWIAWVAPPVFLVGLLSVVSTLATYLLNDDVDVKAIGVQKTFDRALWVYLLTIKRTSWPLIVRWFFGSVIVSYLACWLVNVNLFSLNAMYANRLTRAFLGASRRTDAGRKRWAPEARDQRALAGAPTGALGLTRDPNPVTDFDPDDDLELAELRIGAGNSAARYWGPHVIFNTALNLVGGCELAWRDRKAESFMLTPLHCGARSTGYARTPKESAGHLSVGRAVAVSGAAVDPNMNYHQSPAVTALLTVFNARLGFWIQNPNPDTWWWKGWPLKRGSDAWGSRSASYGGLLVKEFLANTDEKGEYVHISDGGHFDNLGVYELVKRRCRYIVAVDTTENPLATSDNLGILVRLCRVDLGVRIEVDTAPLKVVVPDGISRAHVVIGRVRYDDVDHGQTPGMLIYIKSTLTGDEPPDVQQYANLHSEFPRQSTIDQSFDEDQFESYRALGHHVARVVFEEAAQSIFRDSGGDSQEWWREKSWEAGGDRAERKFSEAHRKIFSALRNRWSEAPLRVDDRYLESTKSWRNLQRDLRSEPALARLARDFYPELAILDDPREGPTRRAELHKMEQVVQFMEDAWNGLGLKNHDEATIGRGWLNVFSRLAGTETFRLFWPLLRAECGPEFVRFCERRLRADRQKPWLREIEASDPVVATLGAEFAREWPRAIGRRSFSNGTDPRDAESLAEAGRRYLRDRINKAKLPPKDGTAEMRTAWLIVDGPVEYEPPKEWGFEFPIGIMVVFPAENSGADVPGKSSPEVPAKPKWAKDVNESYEMLLWVRRAHRSAGVGEQVRRSDEVDALIKRLEKGPSSLLVQYPVADDGGAEDLDRVRWLAFFSLFGFAPDPDPNIALQPNKPVVLYKFYPEFTR